MRKTRFLWLGEAAFCEGLREAPGRLCKKLLHRSCFLRLVREFFVCVFFIGFQLFGIGFRNYCAQGTQKLRGRQMDQ